MDHIDSIIFVEDKHHLMQPAVAPGPPHKPLSIATVFWIRLLCVGNDPLRVFRIDAVPSDVINVPVIPAEVQTTSPI